MVKQAVSSAEFHSDRSGRNTAETDYSLSASRMAMESDWYSNSHHFGVFVDRRRVDRYPF